MSNDVRDAIIEQLEGQYGKLTRKLAYEILHDEHEVEDVIQTALWEIIYKHTDKLNLPKGEFRNYLCTAVKNTAINLYNQKKKADVQDPFVINELTMDQVDTGSFHDEYGFGPELQELLGELNNIDKDIILLRFGCGYSHAEIAKAVGKSEAAVRKRLERATIKLRAILIDREVE
ncbi:RNA polymerase sigma factor [Emergencia sp.]|uniref:RNA polymerase sigma factor n=1 Tax=Emergencia sp. TaxID=1926557 RepID=UPI003AEFCE01